MGQRQSSDRGVGLQDVKAPLTESFMSDGCSTRVEPELIVFFTAEGLRVCGSEVHQAPKDAQTCVSAKSSSSAR